MVCKFFVFYMLYMYDYVILFFFNISVLFLYKMFYLVVNVVCYKKV